MSIFKGVGVAAVTPMDKDGKVNFAAYEKHIDFLIQNGINAIISCGTTGENATLTQAEHLDVVRCAVSAGGGRVPVIAGAGSNDTQYGMALCKGVQAAGADAAMFATPYYNKATQKGLVAHFAALAGCLDIPAILYNIPSRTSLNIEAKTVHAIASAVENIIGIKEGSDDIIQIAEIAALCGDKFDIYTGSDATVVPTLALGGKGVVSTIGNIAPKQTSDMAARFFAGDLEGARALQLGMLSLIRAIFAEINPVPVKHALNLMGFDAGGCRLPLIPIEPENETLLIKEMKAYGLLDEI